MTQPISGWRFARSKIGNAGTGTVENAVLNFNIGPDEAIEIASVMGHLVHATADDAATMGQVQSVQRLHIEDGTLDTPGGVDVTEADDFDNDTEVIFEQFMTEITFNGTTEAAALMLQSPAEPVIYAERILSPINLSHTVEAPSGGVTVTGILMIEYRYVRLTDRELALQFSRRRR